MTRAIGASILALFVAGLSASATTLNVPADHATIQEAIDSATDGDTIVVSPGTYQENVNFNGRNVLLTSMDPHDPNVVAATILDGGGSGSVVTFNHGESSNAALAGFTITGGYGTGNLSVPAGLPPEDYAFWGGGVFCAYASPTIRNNTFVNNIGPMKVVNGEPAELGYGGAIGGFESSAIVTRNIIRDNFAIAGGGILFIFGHPLVTNNVICDNLANTGGGVAMVGGRLINNTIVANEADAAGNVYLESVPEFGRYCIAKNNIIASTARGTGVYRPVVYAGDVFAFNNVWGNPSGDAYWVAGNNPDGNLSVDPMFVDAGAGDYRLRMDSACINAGDPNYASYTGDSDFYGDSRLIGGRVDIGAVEFVGNRRPIANAGEDQATDTLGGSILLDGSGSHDPDGTAGLIYRWSQVAGPSVELTGADAASATFAPTEYGAYVFDLVVGDGLLDSTADSVCIVVDNGSLPIADAGLPAYAGRDPVMLDGTGSYDPDGNAELVYSWQQLSGPSMAMTGSDTATPTIDGFIQTDTLQRCVFELVVYDGQHASAADTVELRIVPDWGNTTIRLESSTFEADRPTFIWFSGGDCVTGSGRWNSSEWAEQANVLSFNYFPDDTSTICTYDRVGDLVITYLSNLAPDYTQPIQTAGASTGGQPAIDVAKYINLTYEDARYAVNRVSFLDARCRSYASSIIEFLGSAVDGEQCWLDTYEGTGPYFFPSILNAQVAINNHGLPESWYRGSLTEANMNQFNSGLVGGAYWSVVGPGKNLQLASTGFEQIYTFRWQGSTETGEMVFYDEASYPGRLPEPVTLIGPIDTGGSSGPVLTCYESENAVGYELLFGSNPNRVMDFEAYSDTPLPPDGVVAELPDGASWWTIRARDAYGSTIYADPRPINSFDLTLPVLNTSSGVRYGHIQDAIDEAATGDDIVLSEGIYEQDITVRKNITIRSTDPDDSRVVMATVLCGRGGAAATVTFMPRVGQTCVLSGLTVTGSGVGIACSGASPMISQCVIADNAGTGIKPQDQSGPTIINCVIARNGGAGIELHQPGLRIQPWATIANCTIVDNDGYGIWGGEPTVSNSIIWLNAGQIEGTKAAVTYSDVQGGFAGEGNLDTDPLFADPDNGDYHLRSAAGRWDPIAGAWLADDATSPCIDAGDPSSDVGDETEPNGERTNIGAYGGTTEASRS